MVGGGRRPWLAVVKHRPHAPPVLLGLAHSSILKNLVSEGDGERRAVRGAAGEPTHFSLRSLALTTGPPLTMASICACGSAEVTATCAAGSGRGSRE